MPLSMCTTVRRERRFARERRCGAPARLALRADSMTRLASGLVYQRARTRTTRRRPRRCAPCRRRAGFDLSPEVVALSAAPRAARHAVAACAARRARPLFARNRARDHRAAAARTAERIIEQVSQLESRTVRSRQHAAVRRQRFRMGAVPDRAGRARPRSLRSAQQTNFTSSTKDGTLDIHDFLDFQLKPLARHPRRVLDDWHAQFMQKKILPIMQPRAHATRSAPSRRHAARSSPRPTAS